MNQEYKVKQSDPFKSVSHRSPIYSTRGMVATSQPLAVAAGLEILGKGGNAADAAIATAAALNVTEPTSTGLGGDCFALYYSAENHCLTGLNGSGRLPVSLSLQRLEDEGFKNELPPYHPYTVTVPGACAGWCDLIKQFGTLSLNAILEPAIRLAENGFPVAPITAHFWDEGVKNQLRSAPGGEQLTINGRAPRAGEIFQNPGLARTLKRIAQDGRKGFYQGEIAEAIESVIQSAGGCLTTADLASHNSTWEKPISTTYHNLRIWECPPNGQGLTALLALNILEGFELDVHKPLSAQRLHLEIEALRLAFADTRWYIADPEFSHVPVEELISKEYAKERRKLIHRKKANLSQHRGKPFISSNTVYLSVVDGFGNACSFINSNYMGFGTGIIPQGWGFSLHNRGHNFSLDSHHPNRLAPGKRPYHTIIPAMITKLSSIEPGENQDELYACFGVMGGFMQPQGHTQVVIALSDDGLNPQHVLNQPRFCITSGYSDGEVALEEGISQNEANKLAQMGHSVFPVSGYERSIFGRGQIILRDAERGVLTGGSDPRADGCVMSL